MHNFLAKRQDVKFTLERFDEDMLQEAINRLTYGVKVYKFMGRGTKKHLRTFFLLHDDYRFLQWISNRKSYTKTRFNLSEIQDISREVQLGSKEKINGILLKIQTPEINIILEFPTKIDRDYFQYGVQYFAIQAAHHTLMYIIYLLIPNEQNSFLSLWGVYRIQSEKGHDMVKHQAGMLFLKADKDGSKQLDFEETKRLLKELHISVNNKYLKILFQTYDVNGNGQIDQSEFINIIRDISKKEELHGVFKKYCASYTQSSNEQDTLMSALEYQLFCRVEQKQSLSIIEIIDLFKSTLHSTFTLARADAEQLKNSLKISFYQFSNFIFNQDNGIFEPLKQELYQDMDRPLSDYYINSSHNTYLMANQLTSDSSCQAYINALLNGCRCVEIDCWDGDKGEPIVYHGHTLTSRIFFKDVIETINTYAFMASPFPVILSFENHCSLEQTKKMALYMREIFKEKLYLIPKDYKKFEFQKSPNQLRGRIMVKSKGTVEKAVNDNSELGYVTESDEEQDEDENDDDFKIISKDMLPDFSGNAQFKQNEETGKKKSVFLQLKKEDQQSLLSNIRAKQFAEDQTRSKNISALPPSMHIPSIVVQERTNEEEEEEKETEIQKEELVSYFPNTELYSNMPRDDQNSIGNRLLEKDSSDQPNGQLKDFSSVSRAEKIYIQRTLGDTNSIDEELAISNIKPENNKTSVKQPLQQNHQSKQASMIGQLQQYSLSFKDIRHVGASSNMIQVPAASISTHTIMPPSQPIHQTKTKSVHKKKKVIECKEMIEITTMFGVHMSLSDLNRACWYISSISEIKYHKLLRKYPKELTHMFKKSFIRLYPSALRVDSSNFDPIKVFLSGAQVVALNFQTRDIPMLLNQSKFMENGGFHSGYLLKPDYLLHNAKKTYYPVLMTKIIKTVRIQIISGQQLRPENYENDTFDVVDPYVQIFIRGTDFDENNNRPQVTEIISDNGFHPIWNSPIYEFTFACPELAMVIFRVMDSDVGADTQLGIYAVPIDCLRNGYRVIPLRSKSNHQLIDHSFILTRVEIIDHMVRPCMKIRKN